MPPKKIQRRFNLSEDFLPVFTKDGDVIHYNYSKYDQLASNSVANQGKHLKPRCQR